MNTTTINTTFAMSNHRRNYQDYIAAYKKTLAAKDIPRCSIDNLLFESHIQDISTDQFDPIESLHLYKQCHLKKAIYSIPVFDSEIKNNYQDCFDELRGPSGFIANLYDTSTTVDDDYLTGSYLYKSCLSPHENHVIVLIGCNQNSIINGFNDTSKSNNITWYGVDINNDAHLPNALYTPLVSIAKSGDMSDTNNIKSISIRFGENTSSTPSCYIWDIYPKTHHMLFNSLIMAFLVGDYDTINIIRLPNVYDWHKYNTELLNFIVFIVAQYITVKLLNTPWGSKQRCYIIFSKPKKYFNNINTLAKYTKYLKTQNVNWILHNYFIDTPNIQDYINTLSDTHTKLTNNIPYQKHAANSMWLKKIYNEDDDNQPP